MGVIDKNTFKLECPSCGVTESLSALEKGSCYGSGGWTDYGDSKHFDYHQTPGKIGPIIDEATCKKCNVAAILKQTE